jgi:hypothetical protein
MGWELHKAINYYYRLIKSINFIKSWNFHIYFLSPKSKLKETEMKAIYLATALLTTFAPAAQAKLICAQENLKITVDYLEGGNSIAATLEAGQAPIQLAGQLIPGEINGQLLHEMTDAQGNPANLTTTATFHWDDFCGRGACKLKKISGELKFGQRTHFFPACHEVH